MSHDLLDILRISGPALHAILVRVTLCEHTAEDLLQELFLRLYDSETFSRADNPVAYARRAALNLALDWRRSRKQFPLDLDYLTAEAVPDNPSPLNKLVNAEKVEWVLNAMTELPDHMREAFVMRYVEQDSYGTIGERFGKTPHQARSLCNRALNQVRNLIKYSRLPSDREGQSHD